MFKKLVILAIVLALAVTFCACGKDNETPSTGVTVATNPTQSSNPTETTTEPTQAPTEEPTEDPTAAHTEAPTAAPTEAPTQAPTATPTQAPTAAPTQKPTTAPTEKPTEPPHTHSFSAATCTKPKTCACGATEGKAAGHSFENGKCTACGEANPDFCTYKNGGNDTIIQTTASGSKNIKVTLSDFAQQNFGVSLDKLNVERKLIFEKDGWIFFTEKVSLKGEDMHTFAFNKIKVDGTGQVEVGTYLDDEDGSQVFDIFGYKDDLLYMYVSSCAGDSFCTVKLSGNVTNVLEGAKCIYTFDIGNYPDDIKFSDSGITFTEKHGEYNIETGKSDVTTVGKFKLSLDGKTKKSA